MMRSHYDAALDLFHGRNPAREALDRAAEEHKRQLLAEMLQAAEAGKLVIFEDERRKRCSAPR